MSVPTVELASAEAAVVDAICRDTGFFAIVGHDVPKELIEETWNVTRAFFDLPLEKKMTVAMPSVGYPYGYAPFRHEALARSMDELTPPDLKETYSIGPESSWDGRGEWPTLWPAEPSELESLFRCYFTEMGRLAARVMEVFARALTLPPDYFAPFFDRHGSALRVLNYPELHTEPADGQLRAGAHSDYGSVTLLLAEPGSTGLEILSPSGTWQTVPVVPDAFIINVGDLLSRWSNDRWVSTTHRVRPERSRRQSIAFFHLPNWDAEIECLPGAPAKYPTVLAGEHLMKKFTKTVSR